MKILRDIVQNLRDWKHKPDRLPLVLQGARQIGKTTTIREFGKTDYRYLAEFNFDKNRDLAAVFAKTKDVGKLLDELGFVVSVPILPEETLIFFDEIQECEDALNSLKYFAEDAPRYHVIAAGSLLGVALRKHNMSFPVGKVNFLQMFPVTFKEYLSAADKTMYDYVCSIIDIQSLPQTACSRLLTEFRKYQICGGLPYVTSSLLDKQEIHLIEDKLSEMLLSYSNDFSKHVDNKDITKIHEIWDSLPSQLSRENKKFIFRTVRDGARAREYEAALQWLILSGLAYRVVLTEKPEAPLKFYEDTTAFKIYMVDIGLLRRLSRLSAEIFLSEHNFLTEFKGAMAENLILNSLLAQGYDMPHYWTLQGNRAEVDFLIEDGLTILPIEVKSDTRISGKSFAEFDKRYSPKLRIRYSLKNLALDGNLLNIPLYLADWTKQIISGLHSGTAALPASTPVLGSGA